MVVPPWRARASQLERIRCKLSLTSYSTGWKLRSREGWALLQVTENWILISDKNQTSVLSVQWLNLEMHYFYFLARSSHFSLWKGKVFLNLFLQSHLPALTFLHKIPSWIMPYCWVLFHKPGGQHCRCPTPLTMVCGKAEKQRGSPTTLQNAYIYRTNLSPLFCLA